MSTELQPGERLSEQLTAQLTDAAAAAPDQLGATVEELRRRGARRRQTRIGVASAAVLLVAGGTTGGVLSGVFGEVFSSGTGASNTTVGAPPATKPSAGPAGSSAAAWNGSEYSMAEPVTTIDTGEAIAGGTLMFWFGVQQDRFLQAVGKRGADGKLALIGVTNDPDVIGTGPGDAGFHAGWEVGTGQDRFVTGYVIGDVAKVTLLVDGTARTAKSAAWGENPAVHVWWLRVPEVPGTQWQQVQVRDLTGYDAEGKVVAVKPDGGVGVG